VYITKMSLLANAPSGIGRMSATAGHDCGSFRSIASGALSLRHGGFYRRRDVAGAVEQFSNISSQSGANVHSSTSIYVPLSLSERIP